MIITVVAGRRRRGTRCARFARDWRICLAFGGRVFLLPTRKSTKHMQSYGVVSYYSAA